MEFISCWSLLWSWDVSLGEQCRARRELTCSKKLRGYLFSRSLMRAIGWGMATSVQVLLCWTVIFEFQCDPLCFSIVWGERLGLLQVGAWWSNIVTWIAEGWSQEKGINWYNTPSVSICLFENLIWKLQRSNLFWMYKYINVSWCLLNNLLTPLLTSTSNDIY